jgi:hypothetical protein
MTGDLWFCRLCCSVKEVTCCIIIFKVDTKIPCSTHWYTNRFIFLIRFMFWRTMFKTNIISQVREQLAFCNIGCRRTICPCSTECCDNSKVLDDDTCSVQAKAVARHLFVDTMDHSSTCHETTNLHNAHLGQTVRLKNQAHIYHHLDDPCTSRAICSFDTAAWNGYDCMVRGEHLCSSFEMHFHKIRVWSWICADRLWWDWCSIYQTRTYLQ